MDYVKLNCKIEPDNELNREILTAELGEIGFESFTETEKVVEAFMPSAQFSDQIIRNNPFFNNKSFVFNYAVEIIPDRNWNEIWEKYYFKPFLIKNHCLIRAPFHTNYPQAKYEIIIKPKMAFGTGNHETTFLMVSEILENDLKGKKVLDMGCGTGILGILSSKMGAASITFIDNDEWAYHNTIENASCNHISNLEVKFGGVELLSGNKYDLILANIQRNILLNDLQSYRDSLIKGGQLIMSGFYLVDLPVVRQKSIDLGLKFTGFSEKNKWIATKFIME